MELFSASSFTSQDSHLRGNDIVERQPFSGYSDLHLILFLTVLISLFAVSTGITQEQWQIISDYRDVREVIYIDGTLWCATSGGLAAFDIASEQFTLFDPADDFAGIGIAAMTNDDQDGLWLAFNNGRLQRFQPGEGITHDVQRFGSESGISTVNRLLFTSRGLFATTNRGVARIIYSAEFDLWVWQEEYTRLGEFQPEMEAHCVYLLGSELWVGTTAGLARADLNDPVPRSWVNFSSENGLPATEIRDITDLNDHLLIATDNGLFSWEQNRWQTVNTAGNVSRMKVYNDSLRVIRTAGIYTHIGGSVWRQDTPPRNYISSFAYDADEQIWGGMIFDNGASYRGGIVRADSASWAEFVPEGPPSGLAADFGYLSNGSTLVVGGYGAGHHGLGIYDNHHWLRWTYPDYRERPYRFQHFAVLADDYDGVWVGTWGGGLIHYTPDDTFKVYDHSVETGGRLIGWDNSALDEVLVAAIAKDSRGNIWLTNRSAVDGNVLVCIPDSYIQEPDSLEDWIYFHRSLFRNFPHFDEIAVDGQDRIWIAANTSLEADAKGVYVLDNNGTIADQSDDHIYGPIPGMASGQVFDLAWDNAGMMWAGSVDGAYYVNINAGNLNIASFTQLYPLRDNQVNSIAVDVTGNKWFGTVFGVTIVSPDLFTVVRRIFDEYPDKLPAKNVNVIGINPHTGWAYFGTDKGTAAMFTPCRDYGAEIAQVTVEPNPFNPNEGRMHFTGNALGGLAKASIFTPDGRLVRNLNHIEAAMGWDGLTDDGHKTASGIYLIVAHNDGGEASQGKVAVIWK